MATLPQGSREMYLAQIAAKIYSNADDSYQGYLRKNPQKTAANYAYTLVMDSKEYANHDFTEREADIIIDKIVRMVRGRSI
jgi:hypothetical protein